MGLVGRAWVSALGASAVYHELGLFLLLPYYRHLQVHGF